MLSSQLELRRSMAAASRAANADDDEDEEGVVYVEGQDEDDWSDSEAEMDDVQDEVKLIEPSDTEAETTNSDSENRHFWIRR